MAAIDISVLYYDENSLVMEKALLKNMELGPTGRVVLPSEFRVGKSIIAVLGGDVEVLNLIGQRTV